MAQHSVALATGVETGGEGVRSVIVGMGIFGSRALKILAEHGIHNPGPGKWYPLEAYLDSFRVIAETIGPATLFAIGRSIPKHALFPPDLNNIEQAIRAIDVAYHMNHRLRGQSMHNPRTGRMTEGIGHYRCAKVTERKLRVTCDNPYPCEFDQGIIESLALRFKPADSLFLKVTHDDRGPCRKKGGRSCTYFVEW